MSSQSKGRKFERDIRDFFSRLLGAERVRLHGSYETHDLTVAGLTCECKVRAKASGLATIYEWLTQAPEGFVVAKIDRRRPIFYCDLGDIIPIAQALVGDRTDVDKKDLIRRLTEIEALCTIERSE